MCTVVLFKRVRPEYALLLAANRDEFVERDWVGPVVLDPTRRIAGGRDSRDGGTWMAVSADGTFVAVTNQRTYQPAIPGLMSRGQLVMEIARHGSPAAMHRAVADIDARRYNAFNLLFGNAKQTFVAYGRQQSARVEISAVGDGVHVLTNEPLDSRESSKAQRILPEALRVAGLPSNQLVDGARALLADHTTSPAEDVPMPPDVSILSRDALRALSATCVHLPAYGTRSAMLVGLDLGAPTLFAFSQGPPCTHPLEDHLRIFAPKP